jgi:hypothetical protein
MFIVKKHNSISLIIALLIASFLISLYSCEDSSNSPNNPQNDDGKSISFLMCHYKGGQFGDKYGLVLVHSSQDIEWISDYYPCQLSTYFVDIKNGRIAFSCENPPDGMSPIAYMDVDDLTNIKFIPIPKAKEENYYWSVPKMIRPQVMSDGRIIFEVIYETKNQYDDFHLGQLAIYNPKTDEFEMSGSLTPFIKEQPEKGSDTELGSMYTTMSLSNDDKFVCLTAYGYGTSGGAYHQDFFFLVKYDIAAKKYSRIAQVKADILFVTADNQYVIVNSDAKKKRYNAHSDNTTGFVLDEYRDDIYVGQYSRKNSYFFKIWRGSGMNFFDANSGVLYTLILGDSLKRPYQGLGRGAQFSPDEKYIYFMASTDFHTNYRSEFAILRTPADYGKVNSNPDSICVLPADFDRPMFLLINK